MIYEQRFEGRDGENHAAIWGLGSVSRRTKSKGKNPEVAVLTIGTGARCLKHIRGGVNCRAED